MTSAVASESCRHLFTAGKEGHIIKWDLHSGKKLATFYKQRTANSGDKKGKGKATDIKGHTDEVLALAVSGDEKVLVSGGRDKRIVVWDVETDSWKHCFFGPLAHKDVVSVRVLHPRFCVSVLTLARLVIILQERNETAIQWFS